MKLITELDKISSVQFAKFAEFARTNWIVASWNSQRMFKENDSLLIETASSWIAKKECRLKSELRAREGSAECEGRCKWRCSAAVRSVRQWCEANAFHCRRESTARTATCEQSALLPPSINFPLSSFFFYTFYFIYFSIKLLISSFLVTKSPAFYFY